MSTHTPFANILRAATLALALVQFLAFGFQLRDEILDYNGVALHLSVPVVLPFGQDGRIAVTLTNLRPTPAQVWPFDTAQLSFSADVALPNGRDNFTLKSLGSDRFARSDGGLMVQGKVLRPLVTLPGHGTFKRVHDLSEAVPGRYLRPGKYQLHVGYDERLKANAPLEVTFVPERDFPKLIELFEYGVPGTGMRTLAADLLNGFTRDLARERLELDPTNEDTPQKIRSDADQIRIWWAGHKSQLNYENQRFVKRTRPKNQHQ